LADEEFKLRAIVEDRISKEMRNIFSDIRRGTTDVTRETERETRQHKFQVEVFRSLREQVRLATESFERGFLPTLKSIATTGALTAGAITAVGAAAYGAALSVTDYAFHLREASLTTGLHKDSLRLWESFGRQIGVTDEAMANSLTSFHDMVELAQRSPGAFMKMIPPQDWLLRNFILDPSFLRKTAEDQITSFLGFTEHIIPRDQRERVLKEAGFDPEVARHLSTQTAEEIRRTLEIVRKHMIPMTEAQWQMALQARENWIDLLDTLRQLSTFVGLEFAPSFNAAIKGVITFLEAHKDQIKGFATEVKNFLGGTVTNVRMVYNIAWDIVFDRERLKKDIDDLKAYWTPIIDGLRQSLDEKFTQLKSYLDSTQVGVWMADVWVRAKAEAGGDQSLAQLRDLVSEQFAILKTDIEAAAKEINSVTIKISPKYSFSEDVKQLMASEIGDMIKLLNAAFLAIKRIEELAPIPWAKILGLDDLQARIAEIQKMIAVLGMFSPRGLQALLNELQRANTQPTPHEMPGMRGRGLPPDWREQMEGPYQDFIGRHPPPQPPSWGDRLRRLLPWTHGERERDPNFRHADFRVLGGADLRGALGGQGQPSSRGAQEAINVVRQGVSLGMQDFWQLMGGGPGGGLQFAGVGGGGGIGAPAGIRARGHGGEGAATGIGPIDLHDPEANPGDFAASMRVLMKQGLTKKEAAALIGESVSESGAGTMQGGRVLGVGTGDRGEASGGFQWHRDRWNPLVAWAREHGINPASWSGQLKMAAHEYLTSPRFASLRARVAAAQSPYDVMHAMDPFESFAGFKIGPRASSIGGYKRALESAPNPGQDEAKPQGPTSLNDIQDRRFRGDLFRAARASGAIPPASGKVTGDASLTVKLARGLTTEGGVKTSGNLFKEVKLARSAIPVASTDS